MRVESGGKPEANLTSIEKSATFFHCAPGCATFADAPRPPCKHRHNSTVKTKTMTHPSIFITPIRAIARIPVLIMVLLLFACQGKKEGTTSGNDDDNITAPADALFQKLPASESNIHFATQFQEDFFNNIVRNPNFYNGGGIGVIDVNKDGLQDLFFLPPPANANYS
jgi:hypothetical protein